MRSGDLRTVFYLLLSAGLATRHGKSHLHHLCREANVFSWSFGGNRLQLKAETHILTDIEAALRTVAHIGSNTAGSLPSLQSKQDLLLMLLDNEHTRLTVWLYPLDHESKYHFYSGRSGSSALNVRESFVSIPDVVGY